jgi:hypothetical protein
VLVARRILVGLAWLYVLGVAIQFVLAGTGLPELGGQGMGGHEAFGYSALHFTPILYLPLAFFAKVPRNMWILIGVFIVVAFLQPIWVTEFQGEWLAALHVIGALVIFILAHTIARQATHLLRQQTPA